MAKAVSLKLPSGATAVIDSTTLKALAGARFRSNNHGYLIATLDGRAILVHRFAIGANSSQMVDHVNHDRLDARRSNLRFVTHSENAMNKSKNRGKRWKGVTPWRHKAYITVDGRRKCLGVFHSPTEAAKAYDRAAIKYFGAFASLNFPRSDYGD